MYQSLQFVMKESAARRLAIQCCSPKASPYAVLPNAKRLGSTGKRTWLVVCSKFEIVLLPVVPRLSTFNEMGAGGISTEITVSEYKALTHSERRPQNIYSQEDINLYCIIKLATQILYFSLQISET